MLLDPPRRTESASDGTLMVYSYLDNSVTRRIWIGDLPGLMMLQLALTQSTTVVQTNRAKTCQIEPFNPRRHRQRDLWLIARSQPPCPCCASRVVLCCVRCRASFLSFIPELDLVTMALMASRRRERLRSVRGIPRPTRPAGGAAAPPSTSRRRSARRAATPPPRCVAVSADLALRSLRLAKCVCMFVYRDGCVEVGQPVARRCYITVSFFSGSIDRLEGGDARSQEWTAAAF